MAGVEGFEPAAFGFGDQRSNQLSYTPKVSMYYFTRHMYDSVLRSYLHRGKVVV